MIEGKKLFAEGKTTEAKKFINLNYIQIYYRYFQTALSVNQEHLNARYLFGVSCFSLNDFDSAI